MKRKVAVVRTLKQARAYILQVGICGIFSDAGVGMPNLWDAVDLPDRQPGEKGWGQGITPRPMRVQKCPDDDKDRQGRHDASRCHRLTELDQLRVVAESRSRGRSHSTHTMNLPGTLIATRHSLRK
jgi:hypothetical protein